MSIQITMLNVGDGDAIVVSLKRTSSDQLLILIDGGHVKDAPATIKVLEIAAKEMGKDAPDLIVCTHYDADHIGGLKKITEHFSTGIRQVWIHQPGIVKKAMELAEEIKSKKIQSFEEHQEIEWLREQLVKENLEKEGELVIESYDQMAELVALLNKQGIKTKEPFHGDTYSGWPEVKVLGPTNKFYKSCYDKISKPGKLLLEEAREMQKENLLLEQKSSLKEKTLVKPCDYLDSQKKDHVTEVNQVSVILEITVARKKYLFTGDASIESFEAIPDYKTSLKNIYWLKVAHHGSHNNSSSELFDIMKPKYADISGGKRYLDDEVRDCLKAKQCLVRTTRDEKSNLEFPY